MGMPRKLALAVAESQDPMVDLARLRSIKALGEPDDSDGFFSGLLNIFFERVPQLLSDLESAVVNQDSLRIEKLAHALKGSCGNLGAVRMMNLAERLESLGRSKQLTPELSVLLSQLKVAYPETREELLRNASGK
jgi:HPt (histidine-containing phosphotransfer) domain-containing protein